MKLFFCVLCCAILLATPARAAADWQIAPVSSLHKITATAPGRFEAFPTRPALLRAARGEWENFQIVVTAGETPLRDVKLTPNMLVSSLGHVLESQNIAVFHERFVRVAQPSGNRRLEKLWWPDALVPIDWSTVEIPAGESAAFWVSVRVPENAPPANYLGALDVQTSAGAKQLFVGVEVQDVALPAPTMRATAALYYDTVRDWYSKNLSPRAETDWSQTKRTYYDFLLDYRINAYDLPVSPNDAAFAAYARDPRVLSIRTPPPTAPAFAPFVAALQQHGALHKAFSYHHDEPSPEAYAAIRADAARLRAAGVPQLVTIAPNAKLQGAVDIWCPNIGDALGLGHLDLESLQRARSRGDKTWWYTMTVPRSPYPTWLLDDEAASVRLYGWQMARWDISGFVYSMVHGWGPKPLEDLRSFAGSNGDGTLVYPGELAGGRGPMPSIRLMLVRDAIEDYELLRTLPEAARHAVTSHVVGASPAERRDSAAGWQNETYRALLFAALDKKPVKSAASVLAATPTLSIADAAAPHTTDGVFARDEWPAATQVRSKFERFAGDAVVAPRTELFLSRRGGDLLVAVRAEQSGPSEWCAVELAPADARERWRFVVTSAGTTAIERHTREGRFRIEGAEWKGATRSAPASQGTRNSTVLYEWNIPLDLLGEKISAFRINVVRRVDDVARDAKYQVRAWPDDGDITRMARARISSK